MNDLVNQCLHLLNAPITELILSVQYAMSIFRRNPYVVLSSSQVYMTKLLFHLNGFDIN